MVGWAATRRASIGSCGGGRCALGSAYYRLAREGAGRRYGRAAAQRARPERAAGEAAARGSVSRATREARALLLGDEAVDLDVTFVGNRRVAAAAAGGAATRSRAYVRFRHDRALREDVPAGAVSSAFGPDWRTTGGWTGRAGHRAQYITSIGRRGVALRIPNRPRWCRARAVAVLHEAGAPSKEHASLASVGGGNVLACVVGLDAETEERCAARPANLAISVRGLRS